jgi:hypothetical protein
MLAHRTSPTNMGLYLLGAACAREFGWISTGELAGAACTPRWTPWSACPNTRATC